MNEKLKELENDGLGNGYSTSKLRLVVQKMKLVSENLIFEKSTTTSIDKNVEVKTSVTSKNKGIRGLKENTCPDVSKVGQISTLFGGLPNVIRPDVGQVSSNVMTLFVDVKNLVDMPVVFNAKKSVDGQPIIPNIWTIKVRPVGSGGSSKSHYSFRAQKCSIGATNGHDENGKNQGFFLRWLRNLILLKW